MGLSWDYLRLPLGFPQDAFRITLGLPHDSLRATLDLLEYYFKIPLERPLQGPICFFLGGLPEGYLMAP